MNNYNCFQIDVLREQVDAANSLVEYSMKHHKVQNIWDKHQGKKEQTRQLRFTGTLGEIVFADTYELERPTRSFGAYDGQDLGKDFFFLGDKIDVKSMKRKSGIFYGYYVLNIPSSQLHKFNSETDIYFCISFHETINGLIASFVGTIDKSKIESGEIGILHKAGANRTRGDGSTFPFNTDTYEIDFADIKPPIITDKIKTIKGFVEFHIR